jgi:molybdopterin molybdotransferase
MLSFEQAFATVRDTLRASTPQLSAETLPLSESCGRVLAEDLFADRDYPPFDRATRDGFALRSAEVTAVPVTLDVVGLARAGAPCRGEFAGRTGCAVEIMTGAPVPEGADAVVMVEYTHEAASQSSTPEGRSLRRVEILRPAKAFDNIVHQGSEARSGVCVLPRGRRFGPGEIGLAAMIGATELKVFRRPTVAILPTGDEVVGSGDRPEWFEIRNSNALALAAQVEAAGGVPRLLGIARDNKDNLRALIEEGLRCDLLVLSGGISVGKYDFVAEVLAQLGADMRFHGVAIRPGKPLAFGSVRGRFFFALPGNPVSTFVTFELFARPALAFMAGSEFEQPVFLKARLAKPVRQNTGLTVFMPARAVTRGHLPESQGSDPVVDLVGWHGSGDLVGLAAANCFLVIHPDQTDLAPGDWVDVLPKFW